MALRLVAALLALVVAAGSAAASPERLRFLEGASAAAKLSPGELAADAPGYLPAGAIDVGTLVPPPPVVDSEPDKTDVALFRQAVTAGEARWHKAVADDASVYDRFADALGLPLDRAHLPRLVRLLNRVATDTLAVTGEAKKRFSRPRPFQRFALKRVCGERVPPKPEAKPTGGTSYPSGHASVSWAAVLIMMEVVPAQVPPLMTRVLEYGQSRVVCGVHFPSDVEAGRLVGAAVVDKLLSVPEFRRDLLCARREYKGVAAGERSEDQPACYHEVPAVAAGR